MADGNTDEEVVLLTHRPLPSGANRPGIGARAAIYDIDTLFLQNQYQIPSYQRDFSWKAKHVTQLLDDLVAAWLGRKVSGRGGAPQYFLGAVVTQIRLLDDDGVPDAADKIVDGQQRITVLMLVFAALIRLAQGTARKNMLAKIYREDLGYFILNSHGYNHSLRRYLHSRNAKRNDDLPDKISGKPPFRTTALQNLDAAFKVVHTILAEQIGGVEFNGGQYDSEHLNQMDLEDFSKWLCENVFVAIIADTDPDDDQRLFDRINTRGLPLSEGDRFMSQVLSGSGRGARVAESRRWQKSREEALRTLNTAEQSGALAIRDAREAERRLLSGWVLANKVSPDMSPPTLRALARKITRDPFEYCLDTSLTNAENTGPDLDPTSIHSDLYKKLRSGYFPYAKKPTFAYRAFYSYQTRLVGLQHAQIAGLPLMDAAIAACYTWPKREHNKRLEALSIFADILSFHKGWNSHWATTSTCEEIMLEAIVLIRQSPLKSIGQQLFHALDGNLPTISARRAPSLTSSNQRWVRYVLGRMAISLNAFAYGRPGNPELVNGIGKAAPEIEHIISRNFEHNGEGFDFDPQMIATQRQRFGALTILSRQKNREASNKAWEKRLPIYEQANILSVTLAPPSYDNDGHKLKDAALQMNRYEFHPWRRLTKENIDRRQKSYALLAGDIWALHRLISRS